MQLIDTSRKLVLDKFKVPGLEGRRIISISSSSIEWVGTQLSYVAVVARGSPIVNILVFKHNENKIRRLYSLNLLPELLNPEQPELNEKQSYLDFPYTVKLSMDGVFLAVTQLTGAVKLIKMPAVLNPLDADKEKAPADGVGANGVGASRDSGPPTGKPGTAVRASTEFVTMQSMVPASETDNTILLKNDLEKYEYEELNLNQVLINTIAAKKKN